MVTHQDRVIGALVGLAVGDALGTTVEFQTRDSYPPVMDMVGGGPFRLEAGQWTDDTSMALCLATSLVASGGPDARGQLELYCRWYRQGYLSSTGRCFDIGNQTRAALEQFEATGQLVAGEDGWRSAGNGSLMRLAPVPMAFSNDLDVAQELSAQSSLTTHSATVCVEACGVFGRLIAVAIQGADRQGVFDTAAELTGQVTAPGLAEVLAGSYLRKGRGEISSSGYVLHTLEAALWALASSDDFEEGALLAVNLGDDADTVAAVYGQLAGALYGVEGIPLTWRRRLYAHDVIEDLAGQIANRVGSFSPVGSAGRHPRPESGGSTSSI